MTPWHDENGSTIYCGDMLAVLPTFSENRFATVITDPPYHLTNRTPDVKCCKVCRRVLGGRDGKPDRCPKCGGELGSNRALRGGGFMGQAWDGGDIAFRPETWREVLRVCKPGAMLLAFGGTRTFHRLACAIEDAGWELRDCIMWLYGSGFPKSLDISKAIDARELYGGSNSRRLRQAGAARPGAVDASASLPNNGVMSEDRRVGMTGGAPATDAAREWSGWGTALKPAWEPIIVAMKPLDGTFSENAQRWGVAGLHIDGARIGSESTVRNQNAGPTWSGEYKGGERLNGSESGRWPANVAFDEAAAAMLDEQSGERPGAVSNGSKTQRGLAGTDTFKIRERPQIPGRADTGGASRFFYTAKASKSDRGYGNDHPTVKPVALLKYLCKLTETPTGGEILDPFGGSMTTLVAAREAGRRCVGIDIEESHCLIGRKRLAQGVLFGAESA